MSDEAEGEEKSEDASTQKLKKARQQGQVSRSQSFVSTVVTSSAFFATWIFLLDHSDNLYKFTRYQFTSTERLDLGSLLTMAGSILVQLSIPTIVGGAVGAFLGNFITNRGLIFSFETIKPNISKLGLKSYQARTFSLAGLAVLLQTTMLACTIIVMFIVVIFFFLGDFFRIFFCGVGCGLNLWMIVNEVYIFAVLAMTFILALLDIKLQQIVYQRSQRSTKTQTKREQKEDSGEPQIRNARRQEHQRALTGMTINEVINGSSLVLHFSDETAVAIRYSKDQMGERYYVVDGATSAGAGRLMAGARDRSKPLIQASKRTAADLVFYENHRQIHDVAIIAEIRQLIEKVNSNR